MKKDHVFRAIRETLYNLGYDGDLDVAAGYVSHAVRKAQLNPARKRIMSLLPATVDDVAGATGQKAATVAMLLSKMKIEDGVTVDLGNKMWREFNVDLDWKKDER